MQGEKEAGGDDLLLRALHAREVAAVTTFVKCEVVVVFYHTVWCAGSVDRTMGLSQAPLAWMSSHGHRSEVY